MIRFSLFGVPVSIHPTLWLTLAILGRGFMVSNMMELMSVLLFIIAALVVKWRSLIPQVAFASIGSANPWS